MAYVPWGSAGRCLSLPPYLIGLPDGPEGDPHCAHHGVPDEPLVPHLHSQAQVQPIDLTGDSKSIRLTPSQVSEASWDHPSFYLSPQAQDSGETPTSGVRAVGGRGEAAGMGERRGPPGHSQHEVLLPGGQVAPHCYGRTLDILHLQGHIGVKLLCGNKQRVK